MYVLSMEDKMAAGASGHAKNYGCFFLVHSNSFNTNQFRFIWFVQKNTIQVCNGVDYMAFLEGRGGGVQLS